MAGTTLIVSGAAPAIAHSASGAPGGPVSGDQTAIAHGHRAVGFGQTVGELGIASLVQTDAVLRKTHSKVARRGRHAASQRPASEPRLNARPRHAAPVYFDPLRGVSGLIPERIDMGVDFGGTGPVYAIGDGVITSASTGNWGWPGGGWVTYRLTDGPDAGLVVYLAENVTPAVKVGEQVTPYTVIADMFNGGDGIETGWAELNGETAESQLPEAGGISGAGPFPTEVGANFDGLLQALGVPAASNASQAPFGLLPAGYPTSWPGITAG